MLFEKLKEAALVIVPLLLVILALYIGMEQISFEDLRQWLVGCALLVAGLALFVVGAEVGLVPFGQAVGASLPHSRNMPLVLIIAFILGVAGAYADPDLHVMDDVLGLAAQNTHFSLFTEGMVFAIGFFTLVGVARILFKIPLKWLLGLSYAAVLVYASLFMDTASFGVAFASGAGATGPIAVSLLMALGVGVTSTAKVSTGNSASFGLVGLLSLGPIMLSVLILSGGDNISSDAILPPGTLTIPLLPYYLKLALAHAQKVAFFMIPLAGLFVVSQFLFLKLPGIKASRMALGLLYTAAGVVFIMTGLMGGIIPCGYLIGTTIGNLKSCWVIIAAGAFLGGVTVLLEPAVWIWAVQVANALGGSMKRFLLVSVMCASGGLGVALGLLFILDGGSIWWFLPAGYIVALALMPFTPRLATGMAFDAGGVITGPMFLFFSLTVAVGVAHSNGTVVGVEVYSLIAFVALIPLIVIQLLGILFMRKESQRLTPGQQKRTDTGE